MTAALSKPYPWDDPDVDQSKSDLPPSEALRLWTDVGNELDRSETVIWKDGLYSLKQASKYLESSKEARHFMERHMRRIIRIFVEQAPTTIGPHERYCVSKSLELAAFIVFQDLKIQHERGGGGESVVLDVLCIVFDKEKPYYKGRQQEGWVGLQEIRLKIIEGLSIVLTRLWTYTKDWNRDDRPVRLNPDAFHQVLVIFPYLFADKTVDKPLDSSTVSTAVRTGVETMKFVNKCADNKFQNFPIEYLKTLVEDLQKIFDVTGRQNLEVFHRFWRTLILRLINSQSLSLKILGWRRIEALVEASAGHRPPPREIEVSSAGSTFVNGTYTFGAFTQHGHVPRDFPVLYEKETPETEQDGGGRKLTIYKMHLKSSWWFISELDKDQPFTDKDVDYYKVKSQDRSPPSNEWIRADVGLDAPPQMKGVGLMVPEGEEFNTLEHQLAQWAVENKIVQVALGANTDRAIIARSITLMKFLASMCERDLGVETTSVKAPNKFCLQTSDLLLAWETCTSRQADAGLQTQISQLLASVLPSCPDSLAIPLLKAVKNSLLEGKEEGDCTDVVGDFCSAVVDGSTTGTLFSSALTLSDEVKIALLETVSTLVAHPNARNLNCYDNLNRYAALAKHGGGAAHGAVSASAERDSNPMKRDPIMLQNDKEIMLAGVGIGNKVVLEECTDRGIVFRSVARDGKLLKKVNQTFRGDREIILAAVRNNGYALKFASENLRGDPHVVRTAFESKGSFVLMFAMPSLRSNEQFFRSLVLHSGHVLQYASDEIRANKDIVLTAVTINGTSLQHASTTMKADKEIVLAAVQEDGKALRYAADKLQKDIDIAVVAIGQHWKLLETAPTLVKNNARVVLAAVSEDAGALVYASESLKNNKGFCKQAVTKHPMALKYLPTGQQADREIVLEAVKASGLALEYAGGGLNADREIVLYAVSNNADALKHTPYRNRLKDRQVWVAALAQNGNWLASAPTELRSDKECVLAAVSSRPGALKYALSGLNQDEDCLVAAGLWDNAYDEATPKIVLSTKFSLGEESSATATEFTLLLKEHPYFQVGSGFVIYSPNAFNKATCDPEWTRMSWPCRGTPSTCRMLDPALKSGKPTLESCWRCSFRYHLERAELYKGFMIQVVEIDEQTGYHQTGKGQQIELVMADQVGIKVFQVMEPGFIDKGKTHFSDRSKFRAEDIDELAHQIRAWYQQNCNNMEKCVLDCPRASAGNRGTSKSTRPAITSAPTRTEAEPTLRPEANRSAQAGESVPRDSPIREENFIDASQMPTSAEGRPSANATALPRDVMETDSRGQILTSEPETEVEVIDVVPPVVQAVDVKPISISEPKKKKRWLRWLKKPTSR